MDATRRVPAGVRTRIVGDRAETAIFGVLEDVRPRGLLFGIGPFDPFTFIVLSVVVITSTLVAAFIPARRATKVHPAAVLRAE